jgi:hypothetical protein
MPCFVPLNELPNELNAQPGIAWNIDPGGYIDADRLVFNTYAARLAMRLAGFSGMRFSAYQGDSDTASVVSQNITGINADGSATGSAVVVITKAAAHGGGLEKGDSSKWPQIHWPVADIKINRMTLAQKISDDILQERCSREQAYAKHISATIASCISTRARENLITDPLKTTQTLSLGTGLLFNITSMAIAASPTATLISYGIHHTVSASLGLVSKKDHPSEYTKLRWSLFPYGFQPDRLALAALLAHTVPLVRARA